LSLDRKSEGVMDDVPVVYMGFSIEGSALKEIE